jgi:hypothetical protein
MGDFLGILVQDSKKVNNIVSLRMDRYRRAIQIQPRQNPPLAACPKCSFVHILVCSLYYKQRIICLLHIYIYIYIYINYAYIWGFAYLCVILLNFFLIIFCYIHLLFVYILVVNGNP